jgi:hypothetical protein
VATTTTPVTAALAVVQSSIAPTVAVLVELISNDVAESTAVLSTTQSVAGLVLKASPEAAAIELISAAPPVLAPSRTLTARLESSIKTASKALRVPQIAASVSAAGAASVPVPSKVRPVAPTMASFGASGTVTTVTSIPLMHKAAATTTALAPVVHDTTNGHLSALRVPLPATGGILMMPKPAATVFQPFTFATEQRAKQHHHPVADDNSVRGSMAWR